MLPLRSVDEGKSTLICRVERGSDREGLLD